MKTTRKGRFQRRALALLIGCTLSFLAAEIGLRILLFSDTPALERLAHGLRQPGYYADMHRDDVFWKLARIWTPSGERRPFKPLSPGTGWTGPRIDPVTLTMADEDKLGERRPVLLYGDSFAECVTPPEATWQGLLEQLPEGRTHALVNFGTSGFGTDQSLTMLESTIGRYAGRNPLVIFSILLDEDPDRVLLHFRGMPKPRYELVGGELVFRPLEETDANTWWENHPPGVASYVWRLFRGSHGPLPLSWQKQLAPDAGDAQVIALNRALITRMHRRLEALKIEHCVLAFHGRMLLENPLPHLWREQFVRKICGELGLPFLSSRPYLLCAVGWKRELLGRSLFVTQGGDEGHYNGSANCAVLEAIRQALHGRYEREDVSGVEAALRRRGLHPDLEQAVELQELGRPASLRFHGLSQAFSLRELNGAQTRQARALGLFPGGEHPSQLEWRIEQGTRFVAEVRASSSGSGDGAAEAVRLRVLVDGTAVRTLELAPGGAPVALEQELRTPCTFALRVEPVAGHPHSCWALIGQPAFL
jgi:hypothetical protein